MKRLAASLTMALALWLTPGVLSRAEPDPGANPASLAGQLIVAAPGIGDPRFVGTVIFLVHQDKDGAFGLMVNRPIGRRPIAELLAALGQDAKGVSGTAPIFAGGPLAPDYGFVLHTADYHDDRTLQIDGHFSVTSDAKILNAIAAGNGPKQSLIAFGYAGWAPGQLEDELGHNDWYLAPTDIDLLFDADRDSVCSALTISAPCDSNIACVKPSVWRSRIARSPPRWRR
jgi:putative transcriptional regulator